MVGAVVGIKLAYGESWGQAVLEFGGAPEADMSCKKGELLCL